MTDPLDLIDVARLEEGRLAVAFGEIADESRPVGGGTAGRAAPGSWANSAAGVAMLAPVGRDELAAAAAWYESAGVEPRFEVCPYADASLVEGLAALGFVPRGFESILFRPLDDAGEITTQHPRPEGLTIRPVDPADPAMVRAYSATVVPQFFPPGAAPTESDLEVSDRVVRHPRALSLGAWMDGRLVGGGGMEIMGEVAALFGLAVLPEYRRRGIQQALIAERLRLARQRGARVATIGSRPGQGTERNVRRMGFSVAYTKVTLVRPGPGLAPVIG